jgi:hypothetical protein
MDGEPRPSPTEPELQLLLQERENRVRELTDQCLHLLDELARHRLEQKAGEDLTRRCAQLEVDITVLRRHLRASRAHVLRPSQKAPREPILDVFLCAESSAPPAEVAAWLAQVAGAPLGKDPAAASITLLCADASALEGAAIPTGFGVLSVGTASPAAAWNLALAQSKAPLAMFLARGVRLAKPLSPALLATLTDEVVALAQPVLRAGNRECLGLEDTGTLRVRRAGAPAGDVAEIGIPSGEAFFVQRAAWAELGPFDEDLVGPGTIVEFALRAARRGFRVLGLREPACIAPAGLVEPVLADRDRLVIAARHRPHDLVAILADSDLFWALPEAELRATLEAVWRRAFLDRPSPEAAELLAGALVSVARRCLPRTAHEQQTQELAQARAERDAHAQDRRGLQAAVDGLRRELESAVAEHRAAERSVQELERARVTLQAALTEREREVAALRADVQRRATDHGNLERRLQRAADEAATQVALHEATLASIAAAFELPSSTPAEAIVARILDLRGTLRAREDWIAGLLREIERTRLRLRRRKLLAHEQQFLAERGAPG